MVVAYITLCSLWFMIWVLYIFKPKWLGRIHYPLHVTGWANNWSMFVKHKNARLGGTYNIFYKDYNESNESQKWVVLPKFKWHPHYVFLGLGVRQETLIRHFVKGILKTHHSGKDPMLHPFFEALCQIILRYKKEASSRSRKVKIEYYPTGSRETVVIESEMMPLT